MGSDLKQTSEGLLQKAEEIFCAAMEAGSDSERRSLLEHACGADERLRAEVELMLAAQGDAEQIFKDITPAILPAEELLQALSDKGELAGDRAANTFLEEKPGALIGPYKLVQVMGEGGCGVVYLAEQDKPVRRQVALKIIKLGMDTRSVIARFEAEQQALALMDHPHIARVLDAGATETGRPYFVMELVRGAKITAFCDENNLGLRERLELFVQVCHAIQHAHQKGIIHRDIKPSNILVSLQDGVALPKVIDFGIAKAMDERLSLHTVTTSRAQLIGTPAYMSPEQSQMSGLDVDTRSDIYSLGVLLYELLTGKTPFEQNELLQAGLDEMRRTLRETDPHWPSSRLQLLPPEQLAGVAARRRVEPRRLKELLRGDLDGIVMKALEKDRKRRYETANALAMDVQHYLNNEPVTARPPSRLYRLRKLVRRNQGVFIAGTLISLALAVGFGVSAWLFFREKEARREAERARANEMVLRRQSEIREKITRATVLLSHGDMAAADGLVADIPDSLCPPYMEAVGVFRVLTDWNAIRGEWNEAARRATTLVLLDRVDSTDQSGAVTRDYMRAAAALLHVGNTEGYSHLCREARTRFATTTDQVSVEQLLKINLLKPQPDDVLASLESLAGAAAASFSNLPPASLTTVEAWRLTSLALYEHRRGNWGRAVSYSRSVLGAADAPARTAMVDCILAMSCARIGQTAESKAALAEGSKLIAERFSKPLDTRVLDTWYSWVMARILLQEAEGLAGDVSKAP
jgi:serine/threonine protein kinase